MRRQPKNNSNTNSKSNTTNKYGVPEPSGRALPLIGHLHLLSREVPIARILGAMADEYGPIYCLRFGKHRNLVLSSWELVKECFTTNDRFFADRPNVTVGKYLFYNYASFALSPYGKYWRDVRKIANFHLLSSQRVESLEHVRVSEINSFTKGLFRLTNCTNISHHDQEVKIVPLGELLEQLMFNILVRLITGKRFAALGDQETTDGGEAKRLMKAIKEATYVSGVFPVSDVIPWLECLDIHGHLRSMKRIFKEIDSVLGKWLEQHRSSVSTKDGESGLMGLMLKNIEENDAMLSGYSRDTVIKATALSLIITGVDSTSLTIIWVVSLLLNNPSVMKAAQEEMDTLVGRDRWVQESDLNDLKFLQAIVKESLRLYPPGPILPREASEDGCIGSHHVPKGTRLIINLWKMHRDPRVWDDPCEFRPERFMTTNAHMDFKGQHFEYIPFSSGRRSCPGFAQGLPMVQLVLARLVQGFELKTKDGMPVDMSEGPSIALEKVKPVEAVLSPRLPFKLYECL
ncbi:hypothetical protein TIFTF001_019424 [Ficus carica]|uniref:Cytochrome P450 n=1 Tax=Ficus carica TaxID=3494 RepID=A0AA88AQD1_FICCA|nr:hypothetical protein TIFTF001_019424 [Ficus carica]